MADIIAILQAIGISALTAGFYALLGWLKSRDPDTGNFDDFKTSKFLGTILLAVVLGGIAGALNLPSALDAQVALGQYGLYPVIVIFADELSKVIARRLGWT
jgi:hypothetical protein